jgi:mediator of RNA polymerase II transcription subunit 14
MSVEGPNSHNPSPSHQKGKEKGRVTDGGDDQFNPHDDAEPFLRSLLLHGHGRLAASLNRVVGILRDTLPVVVELEAIRREEAVSGVGVDTFAKAAGWYRLLYGDLR